MCPLINSNMAKNKPMPAQTWFAQRRKPRDEGTSWSLGLQEPHMPHLGNVVCLPKRRPQRCLGFSTLLQDHSGDCPTPAGTGRPRAPPGCGGSRERAFGVTKLEMGTYNLSGSCTKHLIAFTWLSDVIFPTSSERGMETQLQLCWKKIFASTILCGFTPG